jgi:hypothetical protein
MSVYSFKYGKTKEPGQAQRDSDGRGSGGRGARPRRGHLGHIERRGRRRGYSVHLLKDDLLNALYRELKLELADAMMTNFPRRSSIRNRMQHVWNHYVDWGVANPLQQKALQQITVWGGLTEESKMAGVAPFVEIEATARAAVEQHLFLARPLPFIAAAMSALADMTMDFMRRDPPQAAMYREDGFAMLWAAATRRK